MFSVVSLKSGRTCTLRQLRSTDVTFLSFFFASLSETTRKRFSPHPLTTNYACELCSHPPQDTFIVIECVYDSLRILGYFLMLPGVDRFHVERYRQYGVELGVNSVSFAPVVADDMQSKGLSSACFPMLEQYARQRGWKNMVLLGGTQSDNEIALHWYKKNGFVECGGYQSAVWNIDMLLRLRT